MWGEYINPSSHHAKKEYVDFVGKFKNIKKVALLEVLILKLYLIALYSSYNSLITSSKLISIIPFIRNFLANVYIHLPCFI